MPPIIPELSAAPGQWNPASPDPGAAAAPGMAMASVGRALLGVADDVTALGVRMRRAKDLGVKNKARMLMQQALDEHNLFRQTSVDESTWEPDLQARLGRVRETIGKDDVSPFMREELDTTLSGFETSATLGVKTDAARYGVTRARQRYANAKESAIMHGRHDEAREAANEARGVLFTPEEADSELLDIEADEKKFQEREAERRELDAIDADPRGYLNHLEKSGPPAPASDFVLARHNRLLERARASVRVEDRNLIEAVRDGMYANPPKITRAEDIDELGAGASPALLAELKSELAGQQNSQYKARMATPEGQANLAAIVSQMLDGFNPDDPVQHARLGAVLAQMNPGPVKNYYSGEFAKKIDPQPESEESDWVTRYGLDGIAALEKAGHFGVIPTAKKHPTRDVLAAGAVNSERFLSKFFEKDQVKGILKAGDSKGKVTRSTQLRAMREAYDLRKAAPDESATPYERAAFDALMTSAESFSVTDPDLDRAAMEWTWRVNAASGRARAEFIRWRKAHPDASDIEAKAEVLRIAGEGSEEAWDDSVGMMPDDDEYSDLPPPDGSPAALELPDDDEGVTDEDEPDVLLPEL